jgi:hypothetical protein
MKCKYWTVEAKRVCVLVKVLYDELGEGAGGMLHIVLDDGNLDDDDIQWCIEYCNREENADRHDKDLCLEIAHRMLELSREERMLIYYQWDKEFCDGECAECVIEREDDEWYL